MTEIRITGPDNLSVYTVWDGQSIAGAIIPPQTVHGPGHDGPHVYGVRQGNGVIAYADDTAPSWGAAIARIARATHGVTS